MRGLLQMVCGVALVLSLAGRLVPGKRMDRYVHLVLALLLLSAVLDGLSVSLPAWRLPRAETASAEGYLQQGAALQSAWQAQAVSENEKALSAQMSALAALTEGVADVQAQVTTGEDGSVMQVLLLLDAAATDEACARAAALVARFYALPPGTVAWQRKEAAAIGTESERQSGGAALGAPVPSGP